MRHKPVIDTIEGQVIRIVGCCNGLVCLSDVEKGNVVFWNPATRKSRRLPKLLGTQPSPEYWNVDYGFWFDECADDFKLLAVFGYNIQYKKVSVYSSKSDSWRLIGDFPFPRVFPTAVKSTNGAIYIDLSVELGTIHESFVVSFDTKSETFRQLMLPKPNSYWNRFLDTFNNSFSILYLSDKHADFWVIKESGPEKPWTKLFTIYYETTPTRIKPICIFPSGYCADGDIMMSFDDTIMLYNSKDKKFVDVLEFDVNHLQLHSYVESLISP